MAHSYALLPQCFSLPCHWGQKTSFHCTQGTVCLKNCRMHTRIELLLGTRNVTYQPSIEFLSTRICLLPKRAFRMYVIDRLQAIERGANSWKFNANWYKTSVRAGYLFQVQPAMMAVMEKIGHDVIECTRHKRGAGLRSISALRAYAVTECTLKAQPTIPIFINYIEVLSCDPQVQAIACS